MPSHPAHTPIHTRSPRWRDKPEWGWKTLLITVAVCVLAILVPRAISAVLPDPATTNPPVDVVVGADNSDTRGLVLKGPDGAPLRCQKTTKGLLQGWECSGAKIITHTSSTPEDLNLALQRAVRTANQSELPSEPATIVNGTHMLRLSPEQAHKYAPDLPEGGEIAAYALNDQLGLSDETIIVVVQGNSDMVDAVQKSVIDHGKGGAQ